MKLATSTGDFLKYTGSQCEAVAEIRRAGFKYADYNFNFDFKERTGALGENFEKHISDVLTVSDKVGIKLVQAHAPMGDPLTDNGECLAATIKCIEACGAWEIPNIVVHSDFIRGLTREQTIEKNREFFLKLMPTAEKYGVNILSENFNKMCVDGLYWIDNAHDLRMLIDAVDHPLFHAVWDTGHANLQATPQNEEMTLLGDHIRALHIHDNMGDWDSHLVPYLGTMNLDDVMTGLESIGYNGYFTFEVGGFFVPKEKRKSFDGEDRLASPSIELRRSFERYLFDLGKCILDKYGAFED